MNLNRPPADLLTREAFKALVFARDGGLCVTCRDFWSKTEPGVDAHHVMERRLFPDGGYYLDNGVTLCSDCHLKAEQTIFSPDDVREAAGIASVRLPPHFYGGVYDKWGNEEHADGTFSAGELFFDESVQKALKEGNRLHLFNDHVKYPRTLHLPWSLGVTGDDKTIQNLEGFHAERVIVTEKMDGENTSIYNDYVHARSLDSQHHPSQSWVKQFAAKWQYELPDGFRVCGENLYAAHSIVYDDLDDYFYAFNVWEWDKCLSWDESIEWFEMLGLTYVPVLYDGPFGDLPSWNALSVKGGEGYVIRVARQLTLREFPSVVAKFVRADHVRTHKHWRDEWEANGLERRP